MFSLQRLSEPALRRLQRLVFGMALLPALWLSILAAADGLGANPIEKLLRETGYWTLTLLLLTLAVTPLRRLSRWNWLVRLRRMLGLYAFFYACLHLLAYVVLDQFFDWSGIVRDIGRRPYITVGFGAFLLLLPLAATSSDAMRRRLGGQRWRRLHRLVYVIAVAGVLHFAWQVKKDLRRPLIFAGVLSVSLGLRALLPAASVGRGRIGSVPGRSE